MKNSVDWIQTSNNWCWWCWFPWWFSALKIQHLGSMHLYLTWP